MNVLYTRESDKTVDTVGQRLEQAVKAHQFGVIAIIDLKGKMADKGVELQNACKIYEVCNPAQAKKVLDQQMSIATALPCRIAVYEDQHRVKVATMLPTEVLGLFGQTQLAPVAEEVENQIKAMIDEAVAV